MNMKHELTTVWVLTWTGAGFGLVSSTWADGASFLTPRFGIFLAAVASFFLISFLGSIWQGK